MSEDSARRNYCIVGHQPFYNFRIGLESLGSHFSKILNSKKNETDLEKTLYSMMLCQV